jgi:transcriptional pleiotropic regulator of transition state genes
VVTSGDGPRAEDPTPGTGAARKIIDRLGRVVLPAEMRRVLNLEPGDALNLAWQEPQLVLAKVEDACIICGGIDDLVRQRQIYLCRSCIDEIRDLHDRINEA